jgi:hypothetical protein
LDQKTSLAMMRGESCNLVPTCGPRGGHKSEPSCTKARQQQHQNGLNKVQSILIPRVAAAVNQNWFEFSIQINFDASAAAPPLWVEKNKMVQRTTFVFIYPSCKIAAAAASAARCCRSGAAVFTLTRP